MSPSAELILYACPTGELAVRLQEYFDASASTCGANMAHAFPPHCTLTGFFHDQRSAVSRYVAALRNALEQSALADGHVELRAVSLQLMESFHFILLSSVGVKRLVRRFAATAASPTRAEPLRTKEWLHLSLAYGFPTAYQGALRRVACERLGSVDSIPATWEICLYERTRDERWIRHAAWPLS